MSTAFQEQESVRAVPESSAAPLLDVFSSMLKDTTSQHRAHLFDLNCKICTGERGWGAACEVSRRLCPWSLVLAPRQAREGRHRLWGLESALCSRGHFILACGWAVRPLQVPHRGLPHILQVRCHHRKMNQLRKDRSRRLLRRRS